jgi:DNA polymerase-3 subunit epsilon
METIAVIDFETTGLSPNFGDRATEVAVVLVRDGRVVDQFQSLMNAGRTIPSYVESLTGISNSMISSAPSAAKVMRDAAKFVGAAPVVAHNASFDKKFWDSELARIDIAPQNNFACTMLLARRIYPHSPNHRLGTLVEHLRLPAAERAHRALADANMATSLLFRICTDLRQTYALKATPHHLLTTVQRCSRHQVANGIRNFVA